MTYQCSNYPRPTKETTYPGKRPHIDNSLIEKIINVRQIDIPYNFTKDCQYDKSSLDVKCSDCKWRKLNE